MATSKKSKKSKMSGERLGYAQADVEGRKTKISARVVANKPNRTTYAKMHIALVPPESGSTCWGVAVIFPWEKPAVAIDFRTRLAALHRLASAIYLKTAIDEKWSVAVVSEYRLNIETFSGDEDEARSAKALVLEAIKAILASNQDIF